MAPDARFSCSLSRCFLAFLFLTVFPAVQSDQSLIDESTELSFKYEFDDQKLEAGHELHLEGFNQSDSALILIIRIDNEASNSYRTRFNREFSIQPGPFSLSIPVTALKTSGNHPLPQPYSKMIIFIAGNSDGVVLNKAFFKQPPPPEKNVLALDFGLMDSPVFPGFELILPDDRRIKGDLRARNRPSGDPLIQDGFEGIQSLTLPWPNGTWKLSLWTQEQGEWEYLPHHLRKKIIAENNILTDQSLTPEQWVSEYYLEGMKKEAIIDGDLWALIGERRSGFLQTTIKISDEQLNLFLEGDKTAQFLSGLVLEPVDGQFATKVEENRKARLLSQWPVSIPEYHAPEALEIKDISTGSFEPSEQLNTYPAPRGSQLNLTFQIQSPVDDASPVIAIAQPRKANGKKITVSKRYGHWRFERPQPNATSLIASDSLLRGDMESLTLSSKLPRKIHLQVSIPSDAEPGVYSGSIQLFSKTALLVQDYNIQVLPFDLPRLEKPVGLYLEPAPFYQWFEELQRWQPFSTACDLSLLATMGFTNVAPALDTPNTRNSRKSFIRQLAQLRRFGFDQSILAYAPLKRLLVAQSQEEAIKSLTQVKMLLSQSQLPEPYWSIYDEPVPEKTPEIINTARQIHNQTLEMKTAGHLNNPGQADLIEATDLAIINHGFGVSKDSITAMRNNREVWLYNMPNPRLAAGFYLWKSGADGYLQWHGRMPTADPFDPTDGREGDVIYMYPWAGSCPSTMTIHQRLLDLQEAVTDLRWMQWLEARATKDTKAQELLDQISRQIPGQWKAAEKSLSNKEVLKIRQLILEYAQDKPQKEKDTPSDQ
ncbi:hypothetical protein [Endozoicomonas numazuensis]|uniref:Glycoside hydrolase 123 C-terminal domain-containing protein n=1 Tax=Endozoicomonas numazuensis TaxID=1137799 RepID=A0A081NIK1_9GAMM|nr:hypothetical protein [Endozoicomonas numazuensis]KEQ18274.1 hypothetical protein GZ78_12170 [Endozoicomonas numazuensis]